MRIKSVVLSTCLVLSGFLHAQSKDTLLTKRTSFHFTGPSFTFRPQTFDLKNPDFGKSVPALSLYNKTTNMYDTHLGEGKGYIYSNSTPFFKDRSNFFTTLFLGNNGIMQYNSPMQNKYFMLGDDSTYQVRDSFNPYGATTFRKAVLGGILSLLFN